jgi:hypothetical protein
MSLFLLSEVVYQRRDWLKAESFLETALRLYPDSPRAMYARFMYGRCWWYQASRERQLMEKLKEPELLETQRRYRDYLTKGKNTFEQVENLLLAKNKEMKLPETEKPLLRQASFAAADCYFWLGKDEEIAEAARRYNDLRLRYAGTISELVALSQQWQCYAVYLNQPDKADGALIDMRDAIRKLPDSEFDGSAPYNTREFWQEWLKKAAPKNRAAAGGPRN